MKLEGICVGRFQYGFEIIGFLSFTLIVSRSEQAVECYLSTLKLEKLSIKIENKVLLSSVW